MEQVTIKLICLMEGDFEKVKYKGTYRSFVDMIESGRLIRIYENGKEIWLNPTYIMSFELGED